MAKTNILKIPEQLDQQVFSGLPILKTKEQLNTIIVNKDYSPDYLAINIYYDSLRSWYNPKKQYQEDGNIIHIRKLKSKGIYYSAEQLAKIHGCSKETVRKKLVKLELLGLIHRNFEHKSTPTTNSYNHRCIFVWKNTPHFYNPYGVDRKQIKKLKSQTNAEYVKTKHGAEFGAKAKEDAILEEQGGIHTLEDTKELRELITKVIRLTSPAREASFSQNSNSSISTDTIKNVGSEDDIVVTGSQPKSAVVPLQPKYRSPNKRKKSTNASMKAKIINPIFYSKPKSLEQMHDLLDTEICNELRSKSGRDFSDNFISQRILSFIKSPNVSASFKTKQAFIAYMVTVLKKEFHDATKTSGANFRLRVNLTAEDRQYRTQEKFLNTVEQLAITHVCPENQLKAKLVGRLESSKAYELLSRLKRFEVVGDNMRIHITRNIELTENDRDIILSQVQAVYSTVSGINVERVESVEFVVSGESDNLSAPVHTGSIAQFTKPVEPTLELPEGVWGDIRKALIAEYGVDTDRNWFSKLTAEVDEIEKTIELKCHSEFVMDWVRTNYESAMQRLVNQFGLRLK